MFITAYLPLQPGQELPHRLPLRRPGTGPEPQPVRPNLHIIAHSMGGQASVLACAHAPGIAASLTLIDPAIIPPGKVLERYCKLDKKAYCLGLRRHYDSVWVLFCSDDRPTASGLLTICLFFSSAKI